MDRPSDAEILAIATRVAELQGQAGGMQMVQGFSEQLTDEPPAEKPPFPPHRDLAFIEQLRRRVQALEYAPKLLSESDNGFWAVLNSSTVITADKQWSYAFAEVEKAAEAYSGWQAKSEGRTGTAYNTIENRNVLGDPLGNGVDQDNLVDAGVYTFTLQPCPPYTPVWIREVTLTDGETVEYWFAYENAVDGTCD